MKDTLADIKEMEKNLSFETEDVLDVIAAMEGRSGHIPTATMIGEDANGNVALSAQEALAGKELQSNPALLNLIGSWKSRLSSYTEKSESGTTRDKDKQQPLTGEQRLMYLNKAVELKLVLADIGNLIADANEYRPSSEEKLLGAKDTPSASQPDITNALEPDLPPVNSQAAKDEETKKIALLLRNSNKSIEWIEKNPKGRLVE